MLLARYEAKITLVAVVGLAVIVGLLAYAPVAIVRELRRPADDELPDWMGSARARKLRLAVALLVVGLVGATMGAVVVLTG